MRTAARTVAIVAVTTSLAIGLLGALAPAGQASSPKRPASTRLATAAISGLVKALTGAPLTGVTLPPLIRWRLSHFNTDPIRPLSAQANASTGSVAGTVTGNGQPLSGICVQAFPLRGRGNLTMTTTDKSGRYQLNGLKAADYDITFLADGEPGCANRGNWLEQWYRGVDSAGPVARRSPYRCEQAR